MLPDSAYLHVLRLIPGCGPAFLRRAKKLCGSFAAVWNAPPHTLASLPRIPPSLLAELHTARVQSDVTRAWAALAEQNIRLITEEDPDYPPLLREIPDRPIALYLRGHPVVLRHLFPLAVVGSRKATGYGKRATEALVSALGRTGSLIVSGLAFGIDATAHNAALGCGAPTIAVLGSGIDDAHISPHTHLPLAHDIIAAGGALISELPPGREAGTGTFPARNRIMAGMSLGVLVIEAAQKSGSLITAELALDYGREVFAVPGSIFADGAAGCHQLIQHGARLTSCIEDVLSELPAPRPPLAPVLPQTGAVHDTTRTPEQDLILRLLDGEALHIDTLVARSRLPEPTVGSILTLLELSRLVKNIGGMHYIKM